MRAGSPLVLGQLRPRPSGVSGPAPPVWPHPHPACPALPAPALPHSGFLSRTECSLLSAPWEEDEIRRDRVEPQSVSLSWREPIPAGAPGANGTEYEIRYYEKVR